ncbi:baseplate J/gp47 family protein [Acinetobacter bouvetii]|uniref:Baseplate J-like protein n=1 Tax=Acinetobacter bouvetii TaxID=202951 RepID=A0A811GGY4_9GAMM|nr:baseplate J/gp47 family protein [Acinetobacter bouvetii]CAB1222496.1 Baseplate J-like protein [Acinetobacter bouvetii]
MYSIPTFTKLHQVVVQEIRNPTGLTITSDSDASIRTDGEVSLVEGLYHHQAYILRQLFVQTADEPYLYIHAEELSVPRLGGTRAAGTVKAKSNAQITIEAGTKVTDGKGHFWSVISETVVQPNITTEISVNADQVGASWNFRGTSLLWVSPIAGLSGTAEVISIAGGSDEEELEAWRARMLESKQLGQARDRGSDLERAMKGVPGVDKIYIYKKRRGLGSMDVAITAVGSPPTLPTQALIDAAQIVLDEEAGFWADCRVYSPTEQLLNISAVVKGAGVNYTDVETTIRDYMAELAPVEEYHANTLVTRIMALANVEDVTLTPNSNVQPIVNWMYTYWLRAGTVTVSAAS